MGPPSRGPQPSASHSTPPLALAWHRPTSRPPLRPPPRLAPSHAQTRPARPPQDWYVAQVAKSAAESAAEGLGPGPGGRALAHLLPRSPSLAQVGTMRGCPWPWAVAGGLPLRQLAS